MERVCGFVRVISELEGFAKIVDKPVQELETKPNCRKLVLKLMFVTTSLTHFGTVGTRSVRPEKKFKATAWLLISVKDFILCIFSSK